LTLATAHDNGDRKHWEQIVDPRDVIASVPFFAETLDPAQIDALAESARRVDFDRAATLMREGERGDSLLVIFSGDVSVSVAGRPQTVATLSAGDVVGEMSLLTGATRSATVTAVRPVVALEIRKDDLEPLLVMSPDLFERFAKVVEKRRAELDRAYGPSFAQLYLSPQVQLVGAMRSFFGR
jgi:CRP-like cAMP-binding protein